MFPGTGRSAYRMRSQTRQPRSCGCRWCRKVYRHLQQYDTFAWVGWRYVASWNMLLFRKEQVENRISLHKFTQNSIITSPDGDEMRWSHEVQASTEQPPTKECGHEKKENVVCLRREMTLLHHIRHDSKPCWKIFPLYPLLEEYAHPTLSMCLLPVTRLIY
jgi:hypothetical protein